jgi:phosphoserine phosphatase RsbU/P
MTVIDAPFRVLIADDDRTTTMILSAALRSWSFDVTVTHDGTAAWDTLVSQRPALAIFDWMMPGLDGLELCRRVRHAAEHSGTYIILLTSRDSPEDLVAGLDSGADDYLTKPVDREELRARVHVGVRVATLQARLAARVEELQMALTQVRQLEGLLSICSYCKKVRAGEDSWQQIERYIGEHSNAEFSHGICPTCFDRVKDDFS